MKLVVELRDYAVAGKIWSVQTDPPTRIRDYTQNRVEVADTPGGRKLLEEIVLETLRSLSDLSRSSNGYDAALIRP